MSGMKGAERLRRRAEARLRGGVPPPPTCDQVDALRLVHELQVHQVELQMQYEELLQAKAALEVSNQRYRDLYEFAPVGFFALGSDGVIHSANLRAEALLGVESSRLSGRSFLSFVDISERGRFRDFLELVFASKVPVCLETVLCVAGTSCMHVRLEAVRSDSGDNCRLALSDISRMWEAEEERRKLTDLLAQSQKMEAIGTLAGGVAHDFNNLLCIIIGYTNLALEELAPGCEERSNLDTVLAASQRARELVRQLLSYSMRGERNPVPLDVAAVVQDSLSFLSSTMPKTIVIEQELETNASWALIDPVELHRVVVNLATNALQAMPGAAGRIRVCVRSLEVDAELALSVVGLEKGSFVVLSVEDSGRGMDSETLSKIFEPYFTTKGFGNGTGLGLAVVQGIVCQNKGVVSAASTPGAGSVFTVYLPRCEEPRNS